MKKYIILVIIAVLLLSLTTDNKKHITINEAIEKNLISWEIKGLGGHTGECVDVTIKNTSNIDTVFFFESGRRLISKDEAIQDILIIHPQEFTLAAGTEKQFKGFGFCCQAHKGSPYENSEFKIGNLNNNKLVSLANYLNKHKYKQDQIQNAVWVISDNNPISSIYVPTDNKEKARDMMALKEYVAKLSGIDFKNLWYSLKYKNDTTRLFSGEATWIEGKFDYRITHYSQGTMAVFNDRNKIVIYIFKESSHSSRAYSYPINFSVDGWKKGKYYIRIFTNNKLQAQREFEL